LKEWLIFFALLAMTAVTTCLAGGVLFAISLLVILGAHEFGHYLAARKNGVRTSLPFFVPAPPFFIIGTFGAFILIKEPIPNRKVLMEIGCAGPITGFIVTIPALIVGLSFSKVGPLVETGGLSFGSSILMEMISEMVLGVSPHSSDVTIYLHPIARAGWFGLLITALNLIPVGQLDGGHIIYALFEKQYNVISKIFYVLLIPLGYFWSGWWFWALLLLLIGFRPAPLVFDFIPLEKKQKVMGWASVVIFILTFIPVPFRFSL
jgi:membrane-associated protease RseP (regulator of RpoE activity)